jgi:hypothetical protein
MGILTRARSAGFSRRDGWRNIAISLIDLEGFNRLVIGEVPGSPLLLCVQPPDTIAAIGRGVVVSCKSCGSSTVANLGSEILIHFAGRKNVDKPGVLAFPSLTVCLECGFTELTLSENELCCLAEDAAA